MIRGPGQPRHQRIEQRTGRLGDGLEHFSVKPAKPLPDLPKASRASSYPGEIHDANLSRENRV
jgi:hypothetical protein